MTVAGEAVVERGLDLSAMAARDVATQALVRTARAMAAGAKTAEGLAAAAMVWVPMGREAPVLARASVQLAVAALEVEGWDLGTWAASVVVA